MGIFKTDEVGQGGGGLRGEGQESQFSVGRLL